MSVKVAAAAALVALMAGSAAAQGVVSRADAISAETERGRGFGFVPRSGCFRCSTLGDRRFFSAPLYDDCDVKLLNSLFDEDFAYDIEAQAAFLQSNLDEPGQGLMAAALEITAVPFFAKFYPVVTDNEDGIDTRASSAPQFAAKFFGNSGSSPSVDFGIVFEQSFLCTLKPSPERSHAAADCTADLTPLYLQGVLGNFTYGVEDVATGDVTEEAIQPPLSNFELVFKRDFFCRANDLIFIGTNVETGRALATPNVTEIVSAPSDASPLMMIDGPFTLAQATTLKGTRAFDPVLSEQN